MALKNRSFRVKDETVERVKQQSEKLVVPMYVVMAAAIEFFDPVNNKEHKEFLRAFHVEFDAGDLIEMAQKLTPAQREALIKKLSSTS